MKYRNTTGDVHYSPFFDSLVRSIEENGYFNLCTVVSKTKFTIFGVLTTIFNIDMAEPISLN